MYELTGLGGHFKRAQHSDCCIATLTAFTQIYSEEKVERKGGNFQDREETHKGDIAV